MKRFHPVVSCEGVGAAQAQFAAAHPGWPLRLCHSSNYRLEGFLKVLPAFAVQRGAAPEIETLLEVDYNSDPDDYRQVLGRGGLLKRGRGASETSWCGDIWFRWRGAAVHVRRLRLVTPGENNNDAAFVTLLALDNQERSFFDALCRAGLGFARARSRDRRRRWIWVLGDSPVVRPELTWDNLLVPQLVKEDIKANIESFLGAKEHYRALKVPYRRGFLFSDPPGCGKTLATRIIAGCYRKLNMLIVPFRSERSDAEDIERAFDRAARRAPCALVFEDIDRVAVGHTLLRFLDCLDGLRAREGILVVATANHPERLDPALLHRPSRFDRVWEFPLPAFAERLRMLQLKSGGRFAEAALERVARESRGLNMATVQEIIVNAGLLAAHRTQTLDDAHLIESLAVLRKQVKATATAGNGSSQTSAAIGFGKSEDNGHGFS